MSWELRTHREKVTKRRAGRRSDARGGQPLCTSSPIWLILPLSHMIQRSDTNWDAPKAESQGLSRAFSPPVSHRLISVSSAQGDGTLANVLMVFFFSSSQQRRKDYCSTCLEAEGISRMSPTQGVGKSHALHPTRFCSPMPHRHCRVRAANTSPGCVTAATYTYITLFFLSFNTMSAHQQPN